MCDDVFEFVNDLYKSGKFKDYSDEHFLIKILKGELDYFDKYPSLLVPGSLSFNKRANAEHFLQNFSIRFKMFYDTFNKRDMDNFINGQLAAGKKNYDESQFFRALSEINVINFIKCMGPGFKEAIYEPRLNNDGKNPEARLIFENDIVVDIEVKTPGFGKIENIFKKKNIAVRCNTLLNGKERDEKKQRLEKEGKELILPRVGKIKDFINSAGEKFIKPENSKHINLLFINWTYTEFYKESLTEPLGILYNPMNGIMRSNEFLSSLNINKESLEKITAIILYGDTFNSILFSNFLNIYENRSYFMIPNTLYCNNVDIELLKQVTIMNPVQSDIYIEPFTVYKKI